MAETPDDLLSPEQEVEAIRRISTFYKNGTQLLEQVYKDIDPESLDRSKIEAEVNRITSDLESGTRRWIEESYPELYIAAALVARKMISKEVEQTKKETGIKPAATSASAKLLDFEPTDFDQSSIQSLSATTFTHFAEALGGVRRKTSNILDQVTQKNIEYHLSKQTLNPITLKQMTDSATALLQDAGIGSITDRSGRTWQLDTYAEMLARTQHTAIVNTAMRNQALQEGFDLVIVSTHGATDSCGPFEGKIYSLTGSSKQFPNLYTASAGTHLFAPNCKHTYTPISEERANLKGPKYAGVDSPYLDLRKFVGVKKGTNPGSVVAQQRDLIRMFPTMTAQQQKTIINLARATQSPALRALEDLYSGD